jgi:hypothetical protein
MRPARGQRYGSAAEPERGGKFSYPLRASDGPVNIGDYFCELALLLSQMVYPKVSKKLNPSGADDHRVTTRHLTQLTGGGGCLSMMSEQEILDAAASMVGRYGFDAPLVAGDRSDALTKEGKIDESETWQRILRAIVRLLAEMPAPGETVH